MFLHERMSVGIDVWASKVLLSAVKFKLFTFLGDAPAARPPRAPSLSVRRGRITPPASVNKAPDRRHTSETCDLDDCDQPAENRR